MHSIRRRALTTLFVQLEQRLRHLEHLQVHPHNLCTTFVGKAATSRSAKAANVLQVKAKGRACLVAQSNSAQAPFRSMELDEAKPEEHC